MAGTYYGYADQLAENQVDWGKIGQDLSSALNKELVLRKTKEAALDASVQETTKKISEATKGDSSLENERISQLASNSTQYLQTIQKLWKSGQMSTQQFTQGRQNLMDGLNSAFSLSQEYQDEYKKKMERLNAADPAERSQLLEQWEMGQIDGLYGSMSSTQYYVDPTTGLINLAKIERKDIDGQTVTSIGDSFITINDARNRMKQQYNYWDSEKATSELVDGLGTHVQEFRKKGGAFSAGEIRTISDIRLRTDLTEEEKNKQIKQKGEAYELFDKSIEDQINGMGSVWTNVTSYLTNDLKVDPTTGKTYSFTRNPAEQSENVILLKKDASGREYADFESAAGKKQYEAFRNGLRNEIITKLDTKEEIQTYNEPEPNYYSNDRDNGNGTWKPEDKLKYVVYENTNNALRTGNLKNLDYSKADYKFEPGKKEKVKNANGKYEEVQRNNTIIIYPKKQIGAGYVRDEDAKPIRVYSAEQLAAYVKGVNDSKLIPTELYYGGKNMFYKEHGKTLKGNDYTEEDITSNPYSSVDASQY